MAWAEFSAAYLAFFLSHSVPLRPACRSRLRGWLGQGGFTLAYSALSLAVLAWLIAAAGRAPLVVLWDRAPWQTLVPLVVMMPVCVMLCLAVGRPNPFSFGGARNHRFDPARPGLVRLTRHPLLVALTLWAAAHLVTNGDLAHVILFGSFALFALVGGRAIDRRKQRQTGADWHALRAAVAAVPVMRTPIRAEGVLRMSAGAALYALLIWLHPVLFGVSPLP